jgi:preprotein translocase subunit SecG
MGILGIVLLVLFVIVSLLLIFLVVIQNEGSEGLGGIFAGSTQAAFGSRSSNIIIRATYVLGALFFVTAFSLALVNKGSIGNVEEAAKKAGSTQSEWWTAPADAAPAAELPGGSVQPPAENAPTPSGNK